MVNLIEICLLLYFYHKRRQNAQNHRGKAKRLWSKKWLLRRNKIGVTENLYAEIRQEDYFGHNNFIRMSAAEFDELLQMIGPHIQKTKTVMREPICAKSRLIIVLRHLTTGETQSSLKYLFRIAQNTLSTIINETCWFIHECLKDQYLRFPSTKDEWLKIAEDFYNRWDFVTLGAIDGKHCEIMSPPDAGSTYYNYKKENSLVLMAICDAHYRFIYACVGGNGRVSDGGIWSRSQLSKALESGNIDLPDPASLPGSTITVPFCFIGDEAFPLKEYLMRPYSAAGLTPERRYFNFRLSRARMAIESSFGILSNRFLIFKTALNAHPDQCTIKILACVVLHNFLRTKLITGQSVRNNFEVEEIQRKHGMDPMTTVNNQTQEEHPENVKEIRNKMLQFYCYENYYYVPNL